METFVEILESCTELASMYTVETHFPGGGNSCVCCDASIKSFHQCSFASMETSASIHGSSSGV